MAVANLFKHKVRFGLCGHGSRWVEPTVPSKGYHYSSNWIENGESVGIRSACDLYISRYKTRVLAHKIKRPEIVRLCVVPISPSVPNFPASRHHFEILKSSFWKSEFWNFGILEFPKIYHL